MLTENSNMASSGLVKLLYSCERQLWGDIEKNQRKNEISLKAVPNINQQIYLVQTRSLFLYNNSNPVKLSLIEEKDTRKLEQTMICMWISL